MFMCSAPSLIVTRGCAVCVSANEYARGLPRKPMRETFPRTKLLCGDRAVVHELLGDRNCDRAAGTVRRRFSALQTKTIGLVKTLQVLFELIVGRGVSHPRRAL